MPPLDVKEDDRSRALRRRRIALAIGLVAPLIAWLPLRGTVVDDVAEPAAAGALRAGEALRSTPTSKPEVPPLDPAPGAEAIAALDPDDPPKAAEPAEKPAASSASGAPAREADRREPEVTTGGVHITQSRLETAVEAGMRPTGAGFAPANDHRPAGVRLAGIGQLGVGLRDGDVLTRAGGAPVTHAGAVAGAVRAALEQGKRTIGGVVWRGHHRIVVTVELPRLEDAEPARDEDGSREPPAHRPND